VIDVNNAVGFNASCSTADEKLHAQQTDKIETYHWEFNDGRRDGKGRVVSHLYVTAGTFPAELTVTDSQGNEDTTEVDVIVRGEEPSGGGGGGGGPPPPPPPPPTPDADLAVNVTGPGAGSVGTVVVFTVNVTNNGPLDAVSAFLDFNCNGPITNVPPGFTSCNPPPPTNSVTCGPNTLPPGSVPPLDFDVTPSISGPLTCTASVSSNTADNTPGNNTNSHTVGIALRSPDAIPIPIDTAFTSRLDVPPPNGSVRGQVLLNGTELDQTDNTAPFRHHLKGQKGKNTVEARVVSGAGEGRWIFNFSTAPHFVGGSLVVESGQVISQGADRVVFRVGPSSGPFRFRFRLSP
jgi:hypothetical protein